jgi:PAS domain S-box-containing protein
MITSKLQRYSLVLALCIGAGMLSWILKAPSSCFHLAIVVCCLYGGEGAGLLATGLAILSFDYFFLSPYFSFFAEHSAYPRFAAFIATAVCINLVVAAKQRGDRARREVEEQYRVISETALDGVISIDHDGRVLLVNSAAATIFGYSVIEMIDQPITRFVPQFSSEVSSSVTEMTGVHRDGTDFVAEVSLGKVPANNKCAAVVFFRDITERKRAENALRTSESYLAQAQQLSRTGSFGWDVSSGNLVWSAESFRIAGVDPEVKPTLELIHERIHPEDRAAVKEYMESVSKRGADLDFELRFLLPEGSVKFIRVVGKAVQAIPGRLEYIGAAMDVTAQRMAEDMLRRSESRYRDLVELSPDAIYVADQQGILVSANRAGLMLLGCRAEEVHGLSVAETHLPEDYDDYRQRLTGLRAGQSFRFERIFVRRDGTRVPVEAAVSPIRQGFSQGIVRDISERKQNELELRRSEAYLAEAEHMSHIGSWAWNPATRANTYWSPEMYRLHQRDPLRGPLSLEEKRALRPLEDWANFMGALERSIREKIDLDSEHRLVFPDGSIKYIHVLGHPVIDAAGNVVELFGITRDVTEQHHAKAARDALQKMEARLARASQIATVGEISASIAHEINQPLTAIIANAHMCYDLLASDGVTVAGARSLIQEVLECGYHATEVVQRMRTLFKGGTFERTTLDINDVSREVVNLLRSEASKRRVDLEIDLAIGLPKILGDRVQLQQVLVNLCVNGFDAMDSLVDRPRRLLVRTRVHGSAAIRVEIQDNGIGLREPDRIFETFFTTKQNGMGMGLPICRSIIELHDGHLWPQRDNGPGTTFCFTLPVPDHTTSEPQRSSGRHRSGEYLSVGHRRPNVSQPGRAYIDAESRGPIALPASVSTSHHGGQNT